MICKLSRCSFGVVFDGVPRSSKQIEAVGGAMLGEANKEGSNYVRMCGTVKQTEYW